MDRLTFWGHDLTWTNTGKPKGEKVDSFWSTEKYVGASKTSKGYDLAVCASPWYGSESVLEIAKLHQHQHATNLVKATYSCSKRLLLASLARSWWSACIEYIYIYNILCIMFPAKPAKGGNL